MLPANIYTDSARVFVDYERTSPPRRPEDGWTRFVCISDTHSKVFPIPEGDVLLHAGDLSSWGYPQQLEVTLSWLSSLSHPVKVIIAGNHDLCLDSNLPQGEQALPLEDPSLPKIRQMMRSQTLRDANLHYLEHEYLIFKTASGREWKVAQSTPWHVGGAFQYSTAEEAQALYSKLPPETEILLSHTPPHSILDITKRGKNAGCLHLAKRLQDLKSLKLHVFGHIHEACGAVIGSTLERVVSVNAAMPHHGSQAVIVDLRD